jgi:hypothetical protein
LLWQRKLNENAVDIGIRVQFFNSRQKLRLRDIRWQAVEIGEQLVLFAARFQGSEQLRPRRQAQQHEHGTHVENQHTEDDLVDRLRDRLGRIRGFGGSEPEHLEATKREDDECHRHHKAVNAIREKATGTPKIRDSRVLAAFA